MKYLKKFLSASLFRVRQQHFRTFATEKCVKEASVYIHWPFCARRCSYCNFNKYVKKLDSTMEKKMKNCLLKEAKFYLNYSGIEKVSSIFFGGGTPSLMDPRTVEEIIDEIFDGPENDKRDVEITLEANPSDLTEEKLKGLVQAGVNRLSIGLQAMNDQDLKVMNRDHDLEMGLKTLEMAIKHLDDHGESKEKLKSLSVDLIFGRPSQTVEEWKIELQSFIERFPEVQHLSVYQLTLERGTKLWKDVTKGLLKLPSEDEMADMFECSNEILESSNFRRYEVSNFSRGQKFESVHNWNYWTGGDYIGIGPGAHSRFWPKLSNQNSDQNENYREARIQTLEPDPWMLEVEKFGHGTRKLEHLKNVESIFAELLATSLRTRIGLTNDIWTRAWRNVGTFKMIECSNPPFGLDQLVDSSTKCRDFLSEGLISLDGGLKLTSKGLCLLDLMLPYLILSLEFNLNKFKGEKNSRSPSEKQ